MSKDSDEMDEPIKKKKNKYKPKNMDSSQEMDSAICSDSSFENCIKELGKGLNLAQINKEKEEEKNDTKTEKEKGKPNKLLNQQFR